MFCPKCGSNLPDNAVFCNSCGNKLQNRVAPSAQPAPGSQAAPIPQATRIPQATPAAGVAAPHRSAGLKTTPLTIIVTVLALLSLVFTLLPWFETSSSLAVGTGAVNQFTSALGASKSYAFADSYTVWSLIGLAGVFQDYVSAMGSFGGSRASGAAALVTAGSWLCLILWLVSLVLTIWGLIRTFTRNSTGILRAGCVLLVLTAVVFYIFASSMGTTAGTATIMPVLCIVFAIAAFVCSFGVRKNA